MDTDFYTQLKQRAAFEFDACGLLQQEVAVTAHVLSPQEAIGNPEEDDFPIQKGKERLMQAEIDGAMGQAFTDRFGDFRDTLGKIMAMPLDNNFRRAVFVAALNAGLRKTGVVEKTVHCRDRGPRQCAEALEAYIMDKYGKVKIAQIGFQPRMIEQLSASLAMRVLDLDPDNIGQRKFGITVEGAQATAAAIEWADILLVTGTTLVNGTLPDFLNQKPVVFYGTTIAGVAYLMGWERFCHSSE